MLIAVFGIDGRSPLSVAYVDRFAVVLILPRSILAAKIHEGCILACDVLFGAFRFSMAHG